MIEIEGKEYPTITDAAKRFGVKKKTVYDWIKKGIIPNPPTKYRGTQKIRIFPDTYMEEALRDIENVRNQQDNTQ